MSPGQRATCRAVPSTALAVAAILLGGAFALAKLTGGLAVASPGPTSSTGGAPIGGLAPSAKPKQKLPRPPSRRSRGHWLGRVTVTEYWPAPESWFVGTLVNAPGLAGKHRIDWLYSASGVSMEGDGIGLDGRQYHIQSLGAGGWVTATGAPTSPSDGWSAGSPFWRAGGYWRNPDRAVTFPLASGGWSNGPGSKYVPLPGVSFASGPSLPLHYYQSIAVDPKLIPLASRVYVPAYSHDGHGGWFVAQDIGGAIAGHHIDVYRPPPASSGDAGRDLTAQRIYVIKPPR